MSGSLCLRPLGQEWAVLKLFLGNVLFLACRGAVKSDLFLKRQLAACSLSRARFLVSDFLTRVEMGFVF